MNNSEHILEQLSGDLADFYDETFDRIAHPLMDIWSVRSNQPQKINEAYEELLSIQEQLYARVRYDPYGYIFLHQKYARLNALLEIEDKITDAQYWRCLGDIFTEVERISDAKHTWLEMLNAPRRYRELTMQRKDRKVFQRLPEELTVYRGYQRGRNRSGLSWSLSRELAEWFARRNAYSDGIPMLVQGTCKKSDAFCYLNERSEHEFVVNPRCVRDKRDFKVIGRENKGNAESLPVPKVVVDAREKAGLSIHLIE